MAAIVADEGRDAHPNIHELNMPQQAFKITEP
jgi:hypothetical protein